MALNKNERSSEIYNKLCCGPNEYKILLLPAKTSIKNKISKIRRKNLSKVKIKNSIPEELKFTFKNMPFLYFEYSSSSKKMLIFTTYNNLIHLENTQMFFFCEGTFFSCPTEYIQLYVIHGLFSGSFYPLICCFMSEMNTEAYNKIINFIISNTQRLPTRIIIDSKRATLVSLKNIFYKKIYQ